MRVVIYCIGKVGTKITETLYEEGHEITAISNDEKAILNMQKNLDVLAFLGHIGNADVVEDSKIRGADIFIAVTESDEENIIACAIAKNLGVRKTIARIRNPSYLNNVLLNTSEIGISHVINPEKEVANEIVRLIKTPWASEVDLFMDNKIFMCEIKAYNENAPYLNKKMAELSKTNTILIYENGAKSGSIEVFDPNKEIKPRHHIFILEKDSNISKLNSIFEDKYEKIKNVMVTGGGVTGSELLNLLKESGVQIKLIEKDMNICTGLSKKFENHLIICGDATDLKLLLSENIEKVDCFAAVTGDDEENIMTSLLAKQHGVKKTITKVSKGYEEDVMSVIGLDAVVNLTRTTSNKILKFVRKKELLALSIWDNDLAIMELVASASSRISKKALKDSQFITGAIIGAICRNNSIIFPKKDFKIEANDKVLVFTHKNMVSAVEKYFRG